MIFCARFKAFENTWYMTKIKLQMQANIQTRKKQFQQLGPQVFSSALDPEDAKGYTNCSKVLYEMLKMTKKYRNDRTYITRY